MDRDSSAQSWHTGPSPARIRLRSWVGLLLAAAGFLHALYYLVGMLGGWEKDLWNFLQFLAGLGAGCVGLWIYAWREKHFGRKAVFRIRLIQGGVALFLLAMGLLLGMILYEGRQTADGRSDYILVLGARVRGETITLSLKERLDTAYTFWSRYPDSTLILSGGQGPGEALTEAEAMRRYLLTRGVPENRILLEDRSTSTYENMLYTKEMLEKTEGGLGNKSFTIVTNDYHLFRSKRLAARVGLNASGLPAPTPPFTLPKAYTRELAAVVKSVLLDR